jgi:glutathione S-transferase
MYQLVSFNLCPYVQRSHIVLIEKNVPYKILYIDLRNKPEWFLTMSPTGKVPVVQTPEGVNLFESAVINEYLDEVHEPHLLPTEPLAKAQDRMWRDFMADLYGPTFMLQFTRDDENAQQQLETLRSKLPGFEAEIAGPYFRGDRFSMVDVVAAPALMRLTWVERLAPDYSAFVGLPKLAAWRDAILDRPSVRSSVLPDIYEIFLDSVRKRDGWLARRLPQVA